MLRRTRYFLLGGTTMFVAIVLRFATCTDEEFQKLVIKITQARETAAARKSADAKDGYPREKS